MKTISHSSIDTFNTCQRKWYYTYIQRLRSKQDIPGEMLLGDLVHHGMAKAFLLKWADRGATLIEALEYGEDTIKREAVIKLPQQAIITIGEQEYPLEGETSVGYYGLVERAIGLFRMALKETYDLYIPLTYNEVPLIEYEFNYPLSEELSFVGVIDLVAVNDTNGLVELVDWKFRNRLATYEDDFLSPQLALYEYVLSAVLGIKVDVSLVYQFVNKPPQKPELLKSRSGLSKAHIRTTWETYSNEVLLYGFDPNDYSDMREKLSQQVWSSRNEFYRSQHELEIFFSHLISTKQQIRRTMLNEDYPPIYNYQCRRCPFNKLCVGELTGLDLQSIIDENYEVSTR